MSEIFDVQVTMPACAGNPIILEASPRCRARLTRWTRQRIIGVVGCAITLALLVACETRSRDERASADPRDRPFRVALLTPGPISDQSWNGGAYQGLLRLRDSLGAQISHIQTKTPAEFEENFRQYGTQGYDLVFGHGFEFQEAAREVAPEFPRTTYVITSGNTSSANIAGMVFGFDEPSYLAGLLAGRLTRTNTLGVIGGTELPPVRESFRAFEAGARAVNPRVRIVSSYIGNWDDVSAGKEQALAQLSRGVDIIFQNADAAGLGIFQAVREAKDRYVFGTNSNQNKVAPNVTLGSIVIDLPHAFLKVGREVKSKRFKAEVIHLGMRDQVVALVLNPVLQDKIPATVRQEIDSAKTAMLAGRLIPLPRAAAP